ncbi:MAG TPA: hypothetical protein VIY29_27755 [Ktedonobacteraceae bacterium]
MNFKVLLAALAAAGLATAAQAQTKWDMPTPYADGEFHTRNIATFVEDVKKATNGALDIALHSNGSLIKHPDILRAVSSGQVNIGEILLGQFGNEEPVFNADNVEDTNQLEPALREYQEAARIAPKQALLHQKVGQLAWRLNQLPIAERAFVTALTLNAADHQTRFLLSQVYENEGKLIDAERECSYVVPMIPAAQQVLLRIRSRLGR